MNELSSQFGQKLVILGFPCNQFGHQVRVTRFLISFQYILKLKLKQIRIYSTGPMYVQRLINFIVGPRHEAL